MDLANNMNISYLNKKYEMRFLIFILMNIIIVFIIVIRLFVIQILDPFDMRVIHQKRQTQLFDKVIQNEPEIVKDIQDSTLIKLISNFDLGNFKLFHPPIILFDDDTIIEFILKDKFTLLRNQSQISKSLQYNNTKIINSDYLQVNLIANNATVTPITPETQVISSKESTHWVWFIKPQPVDSLTILISINNNVTINKTDYKRNIMIIELDLPVKLSIIAIIKKYWQVYFISLIAPLILFILKDLYWRKSKKE